MQVLTGSIIAIGFLEGKGTKGINLKLLYKVRSRHSPVCAHTPGQLLRNRCQLPCSMPAPAQLGRRMASMTPAAMRAQRWRAARPLPCQQIGAACGH